MGAGQAQRCVALQPTGGDVDLALWGPRTTSVLESGAHSGATGAGSRSEVGTSASGFRLKNTGRKGAYYYVEAYVGTGGGSVSRPVAGVGYRIAVSIVKTKTARR